MLNVIGELPILIPLVKFLTPEISCSLSNSTKLDVSISILATVLETTETPWTLTSVINDEPVSIVYWNNHSPAWYTYLADLFSWVSSCWTKA